MQGMEPPDNGGEQAGEFRAPSDQGPYPLKPISMDNALDDSSAPHLIVRPSASDLPPVSLAGLELFPRREPFPTAWFIAIVGWTALVAFFHMDGGGKLDTTGCWVAQTAREMQETNNWIVPMFSGETRLQKSPGAYWAVMLTSLLRGKPVDAVSARIPNGIWSIILVVTVFWLARRIAGNRAAVFAGFACASSTLVLTWSHRGSSDLGVTALIALSLTCLWVSLVDEPRGGKRVLILLGAYFAAGLAMLYKMPMPLACVGVPAIAYLIFRLRFRTLLTGWHVVGLVLFLVPWLPWVIAVYLQEPTALAKWRVEYLDRFTGNLPNVKEQQQWFWYLYYLIPPLVYTAPYTLSLPKALFRAFEKREGTNRDGLLFMGIWFLSLLVFFTLSAGKEDRYILPALPPLYVLLGIELAHFFDSNRKRSVLRDRLGVILTCLLVPAGCVAGFYGLKKWQEHTAIFAMPELWSGYVVTVSIFAAGCVTAAILYHGRKCNASFATLVFTMWLTFCVSWATLFPKLLSEMPSRNFTAQLANLSEPQRDSLRMLGHQDPRIIWHSDIRYPRIIDQLELLELQNGERSLERERRIVFEKMLEELTSDSLRLYVCARVHYVEFHTLGAALLQEEGRPMPPTHLWIQTRVGGKNKQYIVFGNQPPPWDEPSLEPPSEAIEKVQTGASLDELNTEIRNVAPSNEVPEATGVENLLD